MPLQMTGRLEVLLHALTHKVPCLSTAQVGRLLGGGSSEANIRRWLKRIEKEGPRLIETYHMMVREELALEEPLFRHDPGSLTPAPDCADISRRARARVTGTPAPMLFVSAGPGAVRLLGGSASRPRASDADHHHAVGSLYTRWATSGDGELRERAHAWESEAALRDEGWGKDGLPLPDFATAHDEGRLVLCDMIGSSYTPARISEIHEGYSAHAYEMW